MHTEISICGAVLDLVSQLLVFVVLDVGYWGGGGLLEHVF